MGLLASAALFLFASAAFFFFASASFLSFSLSSFASFSLGSLSLSFLSGKTSFVILLRLGVNTQLGKSFNGHGFGFRIPSPYQGLQTFRSTLIFKGSFNVAVIGQCVESACDTILDFVVLSQKVQIRMGPM